MLNKKREKEPDPVEEVPVVTAPAAVVSAGEQAPAAGLVASPAMNSLAMAEPADRRQAVASIAAGAAFLRKQEPLSPAPYLILRGLRWGELRTASSLGDSPLLEAPPTELRQKVKRLALAKKWMELLDACEAGYGAAVQPGVARSAAAVRRCMLRAGHRIPAHRQRHPVGAACAAERFAGTAGGDAAR